MSCGWSARRERASFMVDWCPLSGASAMRSAPLRSAQAHCQPVQMRTETDYRRELSASLDRPLKVYFHPPVRPFSKILIPMPKMEKLLCEYSAAVPLCSRFAFLRF